MIKVVEQLGKPLNIIITLNSFMLYGFIKIHNIDILRSQSLVGM